MTDVKAKIRIETGAPSKEVMIVAENELRETPDRVKEATKALRELLRGW
jgi:CRISPR/Cas system-associated protein Cas7 (RAMP superfamily)